MARNRRGVTPAAAGVQPDGAAAILAERGRTLERVQALAREHAGLRRVARDAQLREALTRTELGLALFEAAAGRAEAEARLRAQALSAWRRLARVRPSRRHNRPSKALDRFLARLGSLGQALVIARSGVWRGEGRALHDLRHMAAYARRGARSDVAPAALFSQAAYLSAYPDVAAARVAPLVHYLVRGGFEGRAPASFFQPAWYASRHAHALAATGLSPLEHYVRAGAREGASPHPLFDVGHYLAQGVELAPDDDPLSHYLREGWRRGLSPGPLFDPAWYAAQVGARVGSEPGPPLLHYLDQGWRDGVSPHPLFDARWYRETYPDVEAAGVDPLTHYLLEPPEHFRRPGPWFDAEAYATARGEDRPAGLNLLIDYLLGGAWKARDFGPGSSAAVYLARRPELARTGVTPLEHWARQGRA